jgi:hypothetical protein
MRNARTLALIPLGLTGLFFLVALLAARSHALSPVLLSEAVTAKVIDAIGCFAAAFAFERTDYLRRTWALLGADMVILLVRDVTLIAAVQQGLGWTHMDLVRSILVLSANAAGVVGMALLARAWTVAGIDDERSRLERWSLVAVGVAIAFIATAWPLTHDLSQALRGRPFALSAVASDAGDAVSFVLLVPLALTALAMRGGLLLWPWALLTAGGSCWMIYDAMASLGAALGVMDRPRVAMTIEVFRWLACTLFAAAGFAQRWIAQGPAPGVTA